ncbi:MAG: 6-phosphogluconolactonase [Propionibacteriaceae bacterium]|jgi:6-phosphogluconolactonase|nr:6-phosphogluconolactonase [Propionibacteriaceae bacterium]
MRLPDRHQLITDATDQLVQRLIDWQRDGGVPQIALSGDPLAYDVLAALTTRAAETEVDPRRVGLWWTDDAFAPTHSPERHSLKALSLLGGSLPLNPSQIHPVPSSEAYSDPEAAAHAYAQDLAQVQLDLCLLELGSAGQIAGLFPGQRDVNDWVIGVTDAPSGPAERVTLGLSTLNTAREVWVFASGSRVAGLVTASFAGAPSLPSSRVHGRERTWWFVDTPAAALLPCHRCWL